MDGVTFLVVRIACVVFRLVQFDWYNDKDSDYQSGFNKEIAEKVYAESGLKVVETDVIDFEISPKARAPAQFVFLAIGEKSDV